MLRFLEKRSPCLVDILENKIIYIYLSTEKIDLNKMSDVRLFIKWNYFVHLIIYFWQCDYVKYYIEIVEFDLKSIAPILDFNLIWISSFFQHFLKPAHTGPVIIVLYLNTLLLAWHTVSYERSEPVLIIFIHYFFSKDDSRPLIRNDRSIDH